MKNKYQEIHVFKFKGYQEVPYFFGIKVQAESILSFIAGSEFDEIATDLFNTQVTIDKIRINQLQALINSKATSELIMYKAYKVEKL